MRATRLPPGLCARRARPSPALAVLCRRREDGDDDVDELSSECSEAERVVEPWSPSSSSARPASKSRSCPSLCSRLLRCSPTTGTWDCFSVLAIVTCHGMGYLKKLSFEEWWGRMRVSSQARLLVCQERSTGPSATERMAHIRWTRYDYKSGESRLSGQSREEWRQDDGVWGRFPHMGRRYRSGSRSDSCSGRAGLEPRRPRMQERRKG